LRKGEPLFRAARIRDRQVAASPQGAGASAVAVADTDPAGQPPQRHGSAGARLSRALRRAASYTWVRHVGLLLLYLAAGIAVTWPRAAYLRDGLLPYTPDESSYVWYLWWTAHQLLHPGNPFFTRYLAAPVGTHLGFSTTMPLAGWLLAPVTVLYGPSASYNLLAIITPGLLCYAAFRAARLWLNWPGSIAAGAFYGLSSMLTWQDWYHINLPLTVEAAVRLRRGPTRARAAGLGLALGGSVLVNQESAVIALALAAFILVPWLAVLAVRDRAALRLSLAPLGIGAAIAVLVAAPELVAMAQQIAAGAGHVPAGILASNDAEFGVPLPTMFAPSPRLGSFGLGGLASAYSFNQTVQVAEAVPTFGAVLSALALLGLIAGWRRRGTWALAGLWLAGAVLALGTSLVVGSNCQLSTWRAPGTWWGRACHQYLPLATQLRTARVTLPGGGHAWKPVTVSDLMPYTWLIRVPGLAGLREADRFAIAGLLGAALLAGFAIQWLSRRKVTMPLIAAVVALGALEAGWASSIPTMPTALPAVDRLLARDQTRSIVVDIPFGERGGVAAIGSPIPPDALVLATSDGHRRAISYTSWVPGPTITGITRHAFYRYLMDVELTGHDPAPAQISQARDDLRTLGVGWVVEWRSIWRQHHPLERYWHVNAYLRAVGFHRAQVACLVNVPAVSDCPVKPVDQQVVLFRYRP
jgi:hypothetical protein